MARRTSPDGEETSPDGDEARVPWQRSPWVWSGFVVAVVVIALAVATLVGTDGRDPDLAPVDHTEFCARIGEFHAVLAAGVDPTRDFEAVRRLADTMRKVADVSPDPVRPSAKAYADGLADAVRKVELARTKLGDGSREFKEEALVVVENVGQEKAPAIDAVQNYARKACNIDLAVDPTAPAGDPGVVDTSPAGSVPTGTSPTGSTPAPSTRPDGDLGPPTGASLVPEPVGTSTTR